MAKSISKDSQTSSRIRNCAWGYKCDKTWDGLIVTDNSDIRFCDACDKQVYMCRTEQELASSVLLNRCVAFPPELLQKNDTETSKDPNLNREKSDEAEEGRFFGVGQVAAEYVIDEHPVD